VVVLTVSDDELLDAWESLRTLEGVFSEPASAAGIGRLARGSAARRRAGRLHRHGARPKIGRDRAMTIRVRAPATTANLGAGFDVAGADARALERDRVRDEESALDETHLGVARIRHLASPAARSFDSSTGSAASAAWVERRRRRTRSRRGRGRRGPRAERRPSCSRPGSELEGHAQTSLPH